MNPEQAVTEILKLDSIDEGSIDNFCTNNDVSLLSIAEASLYFQQQEIVDLCEKHVNASSERCAIYGR